jgi:SOS-response transcriptional repressor LexA
MNIERLHVVAITLNNELEKAQVPQHINNILNAITNQLASPNASYLEQISENLAKLKDGLENSYLVQVPRTWMPVLQEIKANEFIGLNSIIM